MHYYKTMRGDHRELWENREALDKYLACLKEYWDEEKQQWKESRDVGDIKKTGKDGALPVGNE